ncbi:hypothetical protein ASD64_07215 [Mesorhizobium sp. Root157]|uniref:hypothetical protein n=1 Tax=Mesorhizobium sp. Root157 TaxID=1736477 RepID=UPI0006F4E61D|nr:hypothetical protein [Mesorhizobium sp. Root157]KQZ87220.1 hypothetical protein ASD64_07215 [Mesorhizobium sp. Root157]
MTHHTLTTAQRELALSLTAVMEGMPLDDAFAAIVSITAATCNNSFDGGVTSRSVAIWLATKIVETVDAGQRGELRMHGEALQ